ncbi:MAG: lysoplasmalogenase [Chitinophagaceae bacterium]|nr:lysoplasmalogenase [Chitinophagaceae bacterium]
MRSKTGILSIVFFALLLGDILGNALPNEWLHLICKPLLMPVLMMLLLQSEAVRYHAPAKWMAAGLFLSWLGDVLLMKGEQPLFFMAGLGSFLLAHVSYIVYFNKLRTISFGQWAKAYFWVLIAVILYAVSLFVRLKPFLGDMFIPVLLYTSVITSMLLLALALRGQLPGKVAVKFGAGAALFVASDSILAYNKFAAAVPQAGLLIMLTYGVAQWLLCMAAVETAKYFTRKQN